jgi:hypothetical protein
MTPANGEAAELALIGKYFTVKKIATALNYDFLSGLSKRKVFERYAPDG